MKKIVIILCSVLLCSNMLMAQGETAGVEKKYTPVAGEFAIGTDMVPLFRAVGNVFYGTGNGGFGGSFLNHSFGTLTPTATLLGKYMVTDQIAARINFGVIANTNTQTMLIPDLKAQAENPLSEAKVEDVWNNKIGGFMTAIGGEYRIGKKRIQGVFGADVIWGYYGTTDKYTYGNKASELNPTPSMTIVGAPSNGLIEKRSSNNWLIGGQLTAGVEFFVIPKLALGGQVNLSYVASLGGKEYETTETYEPELGRVDQSTDISSNGNRRGGVSTNNIGGALYVMFYF